MFDIFNLNQTDTPAVHLKALRNEGKTFPLKYESPFFKPQSTGNFSNKMKIIFMNLSNGHRNDVISIKYSS